MVFLNLCFGIMKELCATPLKGSLVGNVLAPSFLVSCGRRVESASGVSRSVHRSGRAQGNVVSAATNG